MYYNHDIKKKGNDVLGSINIIQEEMGDYFSEEASLSYKSGSDIKNAVCTIGNRFIGNNPRTPFVYRAYYSDIVESDQYGRFLFDFSDLFEDSTIGEYSLGYGILRLDEISGATFRINCMSPTEVYVNEELVFASNAESEHNFEFESRFSVLLNKGANTFLVKSQKTKTGFGCRLGNTMPQWQPFNFLNPDLEGREGCSGFIVSKPMSEKQVLTLDLSNMLTVRENNHISWLPEIPEYDSTVLKVRDLYPVYENGFIYASSLIEVEGINGSITVEYKECQNVQLILGEKDIVALKGTGQQQISLDHGKHNVLLKIKYPESMGAEIEIIIGEDSTKHNLPVAVKGYAGKWLVLGVLPEGIENSIEEIISFDRVFQGVSGNTFWKTVIRGCEVRIFNEVPLFGRWTYPLGVTLYGLLESARLFGFEWMKEYVLDHVGMTVSIHDYALYDKAHYGYPGVNHQIAWLDALDDCGSFGALVLNCLDEDTAEFDAEELMESIASYMIEEQIRNEKGAFYRGNNTMWLDDLYMSIPFLARYYKKTGDTAYIDECVRQMLLYKEYFFNEHTGKLSHIYSTKHGFNNGIAWGRGNGWSIFSLTELLAILPKEDASRKKLVTFYNQLTQFYLTHQDKSGLWNQVIDNEDSYLETSVTAMMICAFSRGVCEGYISRELMNQSVLAVKKAWEGLLTHAVEGNGNIHGICRGSSYSFSEKYYMELGPKSNDPHGIGIIMLAGCEYYKLKEKLQDKSNK